MVMTLQVPIKEQVEQIFDDAVEEGTYPMAELVPSLLEMALPSSEKFSLGRLRDGRLRVVESIDAERMMEGDHYIVEAPELNEFGFGNNPSEALADLQSAIAELYFALEADQERLGPDLASVWHILSRKVRKADATCRS